MPGRHRRQIASPSRPHPAHTGGSARSSSARGRAGHGSHRPPVLMSPRARPLPSRGHARCGQRPNERTARHARALADPAVPWSPCRCDESVADAPGSSRHGLVGAFAALRRPRHGGQSIRIPLAAGPGRSRSAWRIAAPSSGNCSRSASRCAARTRRLWAVRLTTQDHHAGARVVALLPSDPSAELLHVAEPAPRPRSTRRAHRRMSVRPTLADRPAIGIGTSRRSRSGGPRTFSSRSRRASWPRSRTGSASG